MLELFSASCYCPCFINHMKGRLDYPFNKDRFTQGTEAIHWLAIEEWSSLIGKIQLFYMPLS